jgi:hypothetical protein
MKVGYFIRKVYVEHFMLQDLIDSDGSRIKFFLPFNDFDGPATPWDRESYLAYRRRSIGFIQARNRRIDDVRG